MSNKIVSNTEKKYLHRYVHLVALGAFVISILSLWLSYQNSKIASAPHVQVLRLEGFFVDTLDDEYRLHKMVNITGKLKIKNFGRAPVQMIKVDWEPIFRDRVDTKRIMLGISDDLAITPAPFKYKEEPILGIRTPTIREGQVRQYNIILVVDANDYQRHITQGLYRIQLTFSNGQQLTLIPEIKGHVTGAGF